MIERTATLDDTDLAAMLSTLAGKLDKVAALSRRHAQGLIIGWAAATHAEELADILHDAERLVRATIVVEQAVG
ncbi:MAG TPA: hypothetical protein VM677_34795 [Actinokineospora sp.]|jgi:hypothetical protein|nr:hypothetical protein [Actinokineospora sp.]